MVDWAPPKPLRSSRQAKGRSLRSLKAEGQVDPPLWGKGATTQTMPGKPSSYLASRRHVPPMCMGRSIATFQGERSE